MTTRTVMFLCILLTARGSLAAQSTPLPQLDQARSELQAGNFQRAETLFREVLLLGGSWAATANFGHALAVQQGSASGDSLTPARLALVEEGYARAAQLDPGMRVPAYTNLGLLHRMRGAHGAAAAAFVRAADGAADSARTALLFEAAAEYELADSTRAATDTYSRIMTANPGNRRAIDGFLRMASGTENPARVIEAATTWAGDSALAPAVADAMLRLLTRSPPATPTQERRALGFLAQALTNGRTGPSEFQVRIRPRLAVVAQRDHATGRGASALLDVYTPRSRDSVYTEPANASWWHQVPQERRAWSSVLRWMGDWHNQRNSRRLAQSFYEAAVGKGGASLTEEWADAGALVPLALIYAESGTDTSVQLARNVQDYTERLFAGKTAAYQRKDLAAIRTFHIALGTYYASTNQWDSSTGARNAEFQLNRMREVTAQLNREGKQVTDPPDLLARLSNHYEITGRSGKADTLRQQVRTYYQTRNAPEKAESTFTRSRLPIAETVRRTTRPSAMYAARSQDSARITRAAAPPPTAVPAPRPQELIPPPTRLAGDVADKPPAAAAPAARNAGAVAAAVTPARVRLNGVVLDAQGNALPGVRVTLTAGGSTVQAQSDARGMFTVSLPRSETVRIRASLTGYQSFDRTVLQSSTIRVILAR